MQVKELPGEDGPGLALRGESMQGKGFTNGIRLYYQ